MTQTATQEKPQSIYLADYKKPDYLISDVELWFEIYEEHTRVKSRLQIKRNYESQESRSLVLNGEDLKLISIQLDEIPLSGSQQDVHGLFLESLTQNLEIKDAVVHREREVAFGLETNRAFQFDWRHLWQHHPTDQHRRSGDSDMELFRNSVRGRE